jgi:hypothetical protein
MNIQGSLCTIGWHVDEIALKKESVLEEDVLNYLQNIYGALSIIARGNKHAFVGIVMLILFNVKIHDFSFSKLFSFQMFFNPFRNLVKYPFRLLVNVCYPNPPYQMLIIMPSINF